MGRSHVFSFKALMFVIYALLVGSLTMSMFVAVQSVRAQELSPTVSNPTIVDVGPTSATLQWTSNVEESYFVAYSTQEFNSLPSTNANSYVSGRDAAGNYVYRTNIDGLEPETLYYIKVFYRNSAGEVKFFESPYSYLKYVATTAQELDTTPRINFWWGKVNQHTDNGIWETDPDGRSGANIDKLTYCKKWYPRTTSVRDYRYETILDWKSAGNNGSFAGTFVSTECVQESNTSQPDLVPTTLAASVKSIQTSAGTTVDAVVVDYCVSNQGNADINHNNFYLEFNVNGTFTDVQFPGGMSLAGSEYCGSWSRDVSMMSLDGFVEGNNVLVLTVDSHENIPESNEGNNSLITSVTLNADPVVSVTGIKPVAVGPYGATIEWRSLAEEDFFVSYSTSDLNELSLTNTNSYLSGKDASGRYVYRADIEGLSPESRYFYKVFRRKSSGEVEFFDPGFNYLRYFATTSVSPDDTPRINYWWGKVNQHVSGTSWVTDPDGVSGANLNKLEYCKKWYPGTSSVIDYRYETILDWKERGNVNSHAGTFMSMECVQDGSIAKPDLVIKNFEYNPLYKDPTASLWDVQLSFDMTNLGTVAPSQDFTLTVTNTTNGKILKDELYNDLYFVPGYTAKVYVVGDIGSDFVDGENIIRVSVDSKNTVDETNEANNDTTHSISVDSDTSTRARLTMTRIPVSDQLVNGTDVSLFRFRLSADQHDAGFYKTSFQITTSSPSSSFTVGRFRLIESPGGQEVDLTNNSLRSCDEMVSVQSCIVNILFDTGSDGVMHGGEFRLIPAGQTKTYELRGTVIGASSGSILTVTLLADEQQTFTGPKSAFTVDNGVHDDFIWSDLHFGNSSSSATSTAEWYNGYDVFKTNYVQVITNGPPPPPVITPEPTEPIEFISEGDNEPVVISDDHEDGQQDQNENTNSKEVLKQRIKKLDYSISQSEQEVVTREQQMVKKVNKELTNRLKGKLLLQVEGNGEVWYLDHDTEERFYLKDGERAYTALQAFGLGISNSDLQSIQVGIEDRAQDVDSDGDELPDKLEEALGTDVANPDSDGDGFTDGAEVRDGYSPLGPGRQTITNICERLEGKIVLQVESRGQAWYIHDCKRYYMKDGPQAYQIMKYLSLGIRDEDLQGIEVGSFE